MLGYTQTDETTRKCFSGRVAVCPPRPIHTQACQICSAMFTKTPSAGYASPQTQDATRPYNAAAHRHKRSMQHSGFAGAAADDDTRATIYSKNSTQNHDNHVRRCNRSRAKNKQFIEEYLSVIQNNRQSLCRATGSYSELVAVSTSKWLAFGRIFRLSKK